MAFDVTWIGQAGLLIETDTQTICIDPYLSDSLHLHFNRFTRQQPAPTQPSELKADLVLCTHDHVDHLDEETLKHLDFEKTTFCGPDECVAHFTMMGANCLLPLNRGQSLSFEDVLLAGVYAEHTEASIGVVLRYHGITVYVTGDTVWSDKLVEVKKYKPDIMIACVNGGYGNMGHNDAARLAKEIGAAVAIPYHYGLFFENTTDPSLFARPLERFGIRYHELAVMKKEDLQEIADGTADSGQR